MGKLIGGLLLLFFAVIAMSGERIERWSSGPVAPAGFYASSFAYDFKRGRYFVGGYRNGEILMLDNRGQFLQRLGSEQARQIRRLRFDARDQSLWVASDRGIDQYAADALPAVRILNRWALPSRTISDIAVPDQKSLILLDVANAELIQLDRRSGATRSLAVFPSQAASRCIRNGALLLQSGEGRVFVALGDSLWRVDLRSGKKERIDPKLRAVSQFVELETGYVLALQGEADRVALLRIEANGDLRLVERLRLQGTQAAYAGGLVHVLDGSLRHHPDFCGDGRPNVHTRLRTVALQMPLVELARSKEH